MACEADIRKSWREELERISREVLQASQPSGVLWKGRCTSLLTEDDLCNEVSICQPSFANVIDFQNIERATCTKNLQRKLIPLMRQAQRDAMNVGVLLHTVDLYGFPLPPSQGSCLARDVWKALLLFCWPLPQMSRA